MKKWIFGVFIAVSLSACGVAYISPQVSAADGKVRVIPLTTDSVLVANRNTYTPRQIPNEFFQNAGSGSFLRGTGTTPQPSLSEQQRPATLFTRLPPEINPGPYRIGVGDVVLLAIKSTSNSVEELSGLLAAQNSRQGYTVQDDGAIAVPDVGRIAIDGLTLEEAEAQLFERLVQSRIEPTFSLEVAEFNSQRISLGGAVATPKIVPVTLTPLHLEEALVRAGGITTADVDFASIRIYRDGILYQIPLTRYLSEPDLQKTRLAAGDNVFVDTAFELEKAQAYFAEQITLAEFNLQKRTQALMQLSTEIALRRETLTEARGNFQERISLDAVDRDFVYLTGEVTKPGRFAMPFGRQTTLADALYADGGFSAETGNPAQIYVLRSAEGDFGAVSAWHLNARDVTNLLLATRMNLLPNDIVFIAEQPVTRWNRVVQQLIPSLITSGAALASN
ncbi:polysaccharide biosynthesis/export family protein [Loktanella agnita]|uniref:polysaccharide biosynthesis/export family protein n=1 Tax=Loktanella agnita TaxID=287097 RepID=UPI003989AED5